MGSAGRVAGGVVARGLPAKRAMLPRLNLTYLVLSKRRFIQLVEEKHVAGWDDPRMPTLAGGRRRGYTPGGFRLPAQRVGVSKAHQLIEFSILEDCMREDPNEIAPRGMAVARPVKAGVANHPPAPAGQTRS